MYTIRLNVAKYAASRTQKRVITKMNEFLNSGKSGAAASTPTVVNSEHKKEPTTGGLEIILLFWKYLEFWDEF